MASAGPVTVAAVLRPLSQEERDEFRRWIGRSLRDVVRNAARIDDPAELELFAAGLVPPLVLVSGPPGVAAELVAILAEAKGGRSLLRAMSAAAPPPLSTLATEAAARLGEGPLTLAAQRTGTLVPERAFALDADEPVTSVLVACRRPGVAGFQVLGFTFEWPETGGAIKDAFASAMIGEEELERELLEPARRLGVEPEEISPEDAVERLAAGARCCAEVGLGPDEDALPAVTLLLRGGGRPDADELLEQLVGLPALADVLDGDDLEPDEETLSAEIDRFDAALEDWCAEQGFDEDRLGVVTYAGHTMADFRAWYADGDVTGWNAVDLDEYLLEFVPRKVGIDDEDIERFPEAVAEVFRFLAATGRLETEAAEKLASEALTAADPFVAAARDPRRFGLAKAMTAAMLEDGVDPADEVSIQRWVAAYNALPQDERHRRIPAFARPSFLPSETPRPAAPPAKNKRKSTAKARKTQRQARKRSRLR